MQRLAVILCLVMTGLLVSGIGPVNGQQIPDAVQDALDQRGMSVDEARQRMEELGIDPSNPEQAVRRARQLGVPEERIQALRDAAQARGRGAEVRRGPATAGQRAPAHSQRPTLSGSPTIQPGSLSVDQLPVDVKVEVPLQSANPMRRVQLGFMTAGGDSLQLANVSRIRGSVVDGTWRGYVTIPRDTSAGTWNLYAKATTEDTTTTIPTGRRLVLFPEGERPQQKQDPLKYFGYDTFETFPEAFVPEATGPADGSYIVGPDDELRLTVWGAAEFTHELKVDREGRVTVPNVGQFTVAGKRLDELRTDLKKWLSRSYAGLTEEPPTVFMDLSLTRVKPSRVFVLGEVPQPGGYTVSSFATAFNALYSVGGPLKKGTLRDIKIIRDGTVVSTVDLYDYLIEGYSPDAVQLQSNDYLFVPPRGKTVAIEGAVTRPAYYEMKEGETMKDLLEFAGGLKPDAYAKRFQIERIVPFDERDNPSIAREVIDVNLQAVRSDSVEVALADGDRVRIRSIAEADDPAVKARVEAVSVSGAVTQPGQYEIGGGVRTVKDLIQEADGLRGDAYREQADLVRLDDSLDQTTQSLNLNAVMEDRPQANLVLQAGDSLHVSSIRNMQATRSVEISGQVREPGTYRYRKGMTVRDLLRKGGGLTDDEYRKEVFLGRADLFRVSDDGDEERVIPFHLGDAIEGKGMAERKLRPDDEIRIYPATIERLEERFVHVSGAVKDTGRYAYQDNMTLKDVILQANGFTEGASLQAVEITRMVQREEAEQLRARTLQVPLLDEDVDPQSVNFSVEDTMRALNAADEFRLQHRDRIFVRQDPSFQPQKTVTVRGEVQYPGEYTLLRDNERLSSIIDRAGGILPTGYLKGGRLLRPENRDEGIRRQSQQEQVIVEMERAVRGDAEEDVIVQPGDEIVIPT